MTKTTTTQTNDDDDQGKDVISITYSPDHSSALIVVDHPDDTQTVIRLSPKEEEKKEE